MSKAEEFIKAKTRIGSNTTKGWLRNGVSIPSYSLPWLTPDQARKAVEIAMEEMIEWLKDNASNYIINTTPSYPDADFSAFVGGKLWEDLIIACNQIDRTMNRSDYYAQSFELLKNKKI